MDEPGFSASGPFGGFGPDELLNCYATGVFPMGEARDDPRIFLVEPEQRGLIPLDRFHVPSRLKRTVRADGVSVRVDTAFDAVLDACAASGPGRDDSWINAPIRRLYLELNARGHAHSIECWRDERLVGGLYGVTLGGAFFGESMFSRERDASKIALVHLVARLKRGVQDRAGASGRQAETRRLAAAGHPVPDQPPGPVRSRGDAAGGLSEAAAAGALATTQYPIAVRADDRSRGPVLRLAAHDPGVIDRMLQPAYGRR